MKNYQGGLRKYRHAPTVGLNPAITVAPTSTDDTPVVDSIYVIPSSSTNTAATLTITSTHTGSTTAGYSAPFSAVVGKYGERFEFPNGMYINHPPNSTTARDVSMIVTLALGSTLDTAEMSILGR